MTESGIIDAFQRVFTDQEPMYIHGDPAYTQAFGIMGPYLHPSRRHRLDGEKFGFNRTLSSVRNAVEHAFGNIACQWTFTAFPQGMKEGSSPVACYFSSAVLLINCFKCFRGSQTSERSVCPLSTLHEYLGVEEGSDNQHLARVLSHRVRLSSHSNSQSTLERRD